MEKVTDYIVDPIFCWDNEPTEEELKIIKKVVYGYAQHSVDVMSDTLRENHYIAQISEPELKCTANIYGLGYNILTYCEINIFRMES